MYYSAMTVPNVQKRNEFLRYSIAQRAILNRIEMKDYSPKKILSKSYLSSIQLGIMKTIFKIKWLVRDKIFRKLIKPKIILVGTGGHAKVIVDIIKRENKYQIIGCVTADTNISDFEGLRVFGSDMMLQHIFAKGVVKAFVALGDNNTRKMVCEQLVTIGFEIISIVHPSAQIGQNCIIGIGTCIMAGAVINPSSSIGNGCIINTNSSIDHDCYIGDYVHIGPGCSIAGNVQIEKETFLGVGTSVIPKIEIGSKCIIGAGSVVIRNIPDNSVAYGIPASIKKNGK